MGGKVLSSHYSEETVTVQEHERGRVRLGQNDCLQGEKEIRKENSDLSCFHNALNEVKGFYYPAGRRLADGDGNR
jgi:hypothetical protein